MDRDLVEFVVIDQLVPKEHLLRKIDAAVDFTQLYEMVEPLYCEDNGRPSIDPVVLFKMVLIQHLYGLPSLRRTAEEVSLNVAYRWFLGYTLQEETPHFSTVSYNFRHRFTEETVDRVFAWILDEVAKAGYLSPKAVFIICKKDTKCRHYYDIYDIMVLNKIYGGIGHEKTNDIIDLIADFAFIPFRPGLCRGSCLQVAFHGCPHIPLGLYSD